MDVPPPAGMSRDAVAQDFSLRILRHQPLAHAGAAARDFLYGFAPVRGAGPERYSPAYLEFRSSIQADASAAALGYGLALALTGLTAGARRRDEQASAALLFTASAVLVLIPPALFATFDWRYQLPQLTLIPVAAVLGGRLLTRPRRASGGRARRTRPAAAESGLRVPGGR